MTDQTPSFDERYEFDSALDAARQRESSATAPERYVDGRLVVWAPQPGSQEHFMRCPLFECILHGSRGGGKDLSIDTPVLTDRGWVRADEVTYADRLVAIDGSYTRILGIFPKNDREMFRVTFHDGASVVADAEHRWLTMNGKTGYREGGWKVRTTRELAGYAVPMSIPFMQGAVGGEPWRGPDPYMIGLMLGDGTMRSARVTLYSADEQILAYAAQSGWNRYKYEGQIGRACCPEREAAPWREAMPAVLAPEKSVPRALLSADPESRLAVLQGIMDTDGTADVWGKCRMSSTSEQLARDVHDIVWSLGGAASLTRQVRKVVSRGGEIMWRVCFRHNNKFAPFRLERKLERLAAQRKFLTRGIKSIVPVGLGDGVCFSVEHESRCFVVKDWIVTHNTDGLLMTYAQHVGKWGEAWRGVIFRETFPQLADLIAKSERWFRRIFPSADFNWQRHSWEWPSGESLRFGHIRRPEDYWNWHGHELPFIGFEELTNWATDECYRRMFSCCRSSTLPIDAPRWMRSTTNPYGKGHGWVKERFRLAGGAWKRPVVIRDARDENGKLEPARAAIHSHVRENKILLASDPDYMQKVAASTTSREQLKAWEEGSWDIVAGGMFGDVWSAKWNGLVPFAIPGDWPIFRAFDWGSARPFSVGWWARADGSDLRMDDGRVVSTVRGDLIRVREWYGTSGRPNEGLRLRAIDVARGIVERELMWGWRRPPGASSSVPTCRVQPGPADSAIYVTENGMCIATDMAQPVRIGAYVFEGASFVPADKRAGSRKLGWEVMRKMMRAAWPLRSSSGRGYLPREEPGLFVVAEHCPHWMRTVLVLPRDEKDPDDVDCFVAGTMVSTPRGWEPIESIRRGALVDTPIGPRPVLRSYVSGASSTVVVLLSNGSILQGTGRHMVYVRDVGLVRLDELSCGLALEPRSIEACGSRYWIAAMESWRRSSMGSSIASTRSDAISRLAAQRLRRADRSCIESSGLDIEVGSRRACTSTTSMVTLSITRSATSSSFADPIMRGCIFASEAERSPWLTRNGARARGAAQRFAPTVTRCVRVHRSANCRAAIVDDLSSRDIRLSGTATTSALDSTDRGCSSSRARSVALSFGASRIRRARCRRAPIRVVGIFVEETPRDVFNLTVEDAGLFFVSGGILSSNTDAEDHCGDESRYMVRGTVQGEAVTRARGMR